MSANRHYRYILNKCRDNQDKALFYVRKTLENGWSRAMLLNFLDTDLYERQGKAITNFDMTLPERDSDLAQEITKDPYNFDFLTLTDRLALDTLCEGRLSFLEISTFPEMLIYSTPTISSKTPDLFRSFLLSASKSSQ